MDGLGVNLIWLLHLIVVRSFFFYDLGSRGSSNVIWVDLLTRPNKGLRLVYIQEHISPVSVVCYLWFDLF